MLSFSGIQSYIPAKGHTTLMGVNKKRAAATRVPWPCNMVVSTCSRYRYITQMIHKNTHITSTCSRFHRFKKNALTRPKNPNSSWVRQLAGAGPINFRSGAPALFRVQCCSWPPHCATEHFFRRDPASARFDFEQSRARHGGSTFTSAG